MAHGKAENEVEQKIDLSVADLEAVFAALSRKVSDTDISHKYRPRAYYDTQDLLLHQNKIALRVQYKPGKNGKLGCHEQTVKVELPTPTAGVLNRKECKDDLKDASPDMAAATDAVAVAALKPFLGKKLVHIFTAAVERRAFELEVKGGKVEVAFDVGHLMLPGGEVSEKFAEIEIEVKRGGAELIEPVREKILRLAPQAKVQPQSKADQGIALYLKHKKP